MSVSTSPYHESVVKSGEFELLASCVLNHAVKDNGHCRGVVVGNACIGVMSARPAWNNSDHKICKTLHAHIALLRVGCTGCTLQTDLDSYSRARNGSAQIAVSVRGMNMMQHVSGADSCLTH